MQRQQRQKTPCLGMIDVLASIATRQGVHLVAAYLPDEGMVPAQMAVAQKENEILVVLTLLGRLALAGMVGGARCRPSEP